MRNAVRVSYDLSTGLRAFLSKLFKHEVGQTLVEYGVILALISVVSIVALEVVGADTSAVFEEAAAVFGDGTDGGNTGGGGDAGAGGAGNDANRPVSDVGNTAPLR